MFFLPHSSVMQLAVLAGDFLLSRACVALASLKNTEVSCFLCINEHVKVDWAIMWGNTYLFFVSNTLPVPSLCVLRLYHYWQKWWSILSRVKPCKWQQHLNNVVGILHYFHHIYKFCFFLSFFQHIFFEKILSLINKIPWSSTKSAF